MTVLEMARTYFDPRGRASRKGFLVASCAIFGVEIFGSALIHGVGIAPDHAIIIVLKSLMIWMCAVAIIKRLHDLGYSALWLLGAVAGIAAWVAVYVSALIATVGLAGMNPISIWFYVLHAGAISPALGLLLWLQLAQGQMHINTFGFVPDASGFGAPERQAEAVQTMTPRPQH